MNHKKNNKEIEIKIQIEDKNEIKEIQKKLKSLNGISAPKIFQRTFRLDTPSFDLEQKGIFLRTRKEGENAVMTVKIKFLKTNNTNYFQRKEFEISIDSAENGAELLRNLGFSKQKIFEKYRELWTFEKKEVQVTIDNLPFGDFIEIEGSKKEIEEMIKSLGMINKKRIINTYWDLFDEWKKKKGINGKDIVFD